MKAVNDRLSRENSPSPAGPLSRVDAELEALRAETAQALREANATLKAVGGKLEQANLRNTELQQRIRELEDKLKK